jgi:hypothetical protein|tara:strand:- start:1268 stop:1738 length:471 start_codon:yes stop_codon:yes gene_type:complete
MAIVSAICSTFKQELLQGGHNFNTSAQTPAGMAFKLALYNSATMGATTTVYSTSNETTGTGYTAGGKALVNLGVTGGSSATTAFVDFTDLSGASAWTSSTFTTEGCLIYNTNITSGFTTDRAVCVVSFGGAKSVSAGTFTIEFPAATTGAAIIRLA